MNRYFIKTNTHKMDIPYDPWYITTGHDFEVIDVETFETILRTENGEYADYVCNYWNKLRSNNDKQD